MVHRASPKHKWYIALALSLKKGVCSVLRVVGTAQRGNCGTLDATTCSCPRHSSEQSMSAD